MPEMEEVEVGLVDEWVSPAMCHTSEKWCAWELVQRHMAARRTWLWSPEKGDGDRRLHVGKRETLLLSNSSRECRHCFLRSYMYEGEGIEEP